MIASCSASLPLAAIQASHAGSRPSVVSQTPIDWDFQRWRRTLQSYRIDGMPIFDPARRQDGEDLDKLSTWEASREAGEAGNGKRPIEPCADILARTAGQRPITDDNMGTEWQHFLGLD